MDNGINYIDKVGLEELVTYHEAGFETIDGYYYDQGRNNTIIHVIEDLYNLRLKLKQDKNPDQMVIKLLMNSMYGKTIIKPVEADTIVKDNRDDFEKYTPYNYNYIGSVIVVSDIFYIKKAKPILPHYNYVHCGVEILSMSKRVMNKVFSCADDCDVKTYYQDAGSIHLNYDDVDTAAERYKQEYGLELVGARKLPYRLLNG